jgi:hypothetical protein
VYLLVLIWWIVCLWIDEPGTAVVVKDVAAGEITPGEAAIVFELPKGTQE